jgi:hypothetical protein
MAFDDFQIMDQSICADSSRMTRILKTEIFDPCKSVSSVLSAIRF